MPAEQDEVVEAGLAAVGPVVSVVGVEVMPVGAAGPLAGLVVAGLERLAELGWDGAAFASDGERRPVPFGDRERSRVAAEAAGGFGADDGAIVELAASLDDQLGAAVATSSAPGRNRRGRNRSADSSRRRRCAG